MLSVFCILIIFFFLFLQSPWDYEYLFTIICAASQLCMFLSCVAAAVRKFIRGKEKRKRQQRGGGLSINQEDEEKKVEEVAAGKTATVVEFFSSYRFFISFFCFIIFSCTKQYFFLVSSMQREKESFQKQLRFRGIFE